MCESYSMNGSERRFAQQRGFVLVLAVVLLPVIIMLATFSFQMYQLQILRSESQSAADAAALAGAEAFDGGLTGWLQVKRLIVATLSRNEVLASSLEPDGTVVFNQGALDPMETDPDLRGTSATIGDFTVTIERGMMSFNPATEQREFRSLEGVDAAAGRTVTEINGSPTLFAFGMPVTALSNAVRVRVVRDDLLLASFVPGWEAWSNIPVDAVAQGGKLSEECVAPMAIPLCDLFANTTSNDLQDPMVVVDSYDAAVQCQREVIVSDPELLQINSNEDRIDGWTRFLSYVHYPGGNQRLLPIRGVLGTTMSGVSVEGAIISHLQSMNNGNCVRARVGDRFRPLPSINTLGVDPMDGQLFLEKSLNQLLQGSEATMSQVFRPDGSDAPNVPYINSILPPGQRKVVFPAPHGVGHLMVNQSSPVSDQWTNPLCTQQDDDGAVLQNQWNSPVRRIKIPVVIGTTPDSSGTADYCSFEETFRYLGQKTTTPNSDTSPEVVGFVTAYLFDYNLDRYSDNDTFAPANSLDTPPASFVISPVVPVDAAPGTDEWVDMVLSQSTEYVISHKQWQECVADCFAASQCNACEECQEGCSTSCNTTCSETCDGECGAEPESGDYPSAEALADAHEDWEACVATQEDCEEDCLTNDCVACEPGCVESCEPCEVECPECEEQPFPVVEENELYRGYGDGPEGCWEVVNPVVTDVEVVSEAEQEVRTTNNCRNNPLANGCKLFYARGMLSAPLSPGGEAPIKYCLKADPPLVTGDECLTAVWKRANNCPDEPAYCFEGRFEYFDGNVKQVKAKVRVVDAVVNSDFSELSSQDQNDVLDTFRDLLGSGLPVSGLSSPKFCYPRPYKTTVCREPECWSPPAPRAAQFGCGGLRLRLDCNETSLVGGQSGTIQRAQLVE